MWSFASLLFLTFLVWLYCNGHVWLLQQSQSPGQGRHRVLDRAGTESWTGPAQGPGEGRHRVLDRAGWRVLGALNKNSVWGPLIDKIKYYGGKARNNRRALIQCFVCLLGRPWSWRMQGLDRLCPHRTALPVLSTSHSTRRACGSSLGLHRHSLGGYRLKSFWSFCNAVLSCQFGGLDDLVLHQLVIRCNLTLSQSGPVGHLSSYW